LEFLDSSLFAVYRLGRSISGEVERVQALKPKFINRFRALFTESRNAAIVVTIVLVRSAPKKKELRASLRRKEVFLFVPYPALRFSDAQQTRIREAP
jgi:hypothetical protein